MSRFPYLRKWINKLRDIDHVHCVFRRHLSNAPSTSAGFQQKFKSEKVDMKKIRNIGIIAHIDAGKTTTTERMLYYCGFTRSMGDVDSGSTVTDYMEQERERGITITSAAITFYYNKHRLNLIDTPGHVDFTLEVERCLRVLDGAVTILDASAGVEAQTVTVWRQAHRFRIPSIVYLNKMDKPNADVAMCVSTIKEKLKIDPVMLQTPIGQGKSFRGVADLINMELLEWPDDADGKVYKKTPITPQIPQFDELQRHRRALIEKVAQHDDRLADTVLAQESDDPYSRISTTDIISALRRTTLKRQLAPILCGASSRNKGVQPILQSICDYLPSPDEREHAFMRYYGADELCGLVFKIIHDRHHGALTFVRIYKGRLAAGMKIYNATRGCTEAIQRVCVPHSDEMEDVGEVAAGNIAVVPNLKFSFTGDTIVESEEAVRKAAELFENDRRKDAKKGNAAEDAETLDEIDSSQRGKLVLASIRAPEPVFFCSIEAPSYRQTAQFEQALQQLAREDPSLRFVEDAENQQTVMEGMGQLHIEIIRDRLLKEYKLDVFLGPLQINYRESISGVGEAYKTLKESVVKEQQKKENFEVTVGLRVEPAKPGSGPLKKLKLRHVVGENYLEKLPENYMDAAFQGCLHALGNGPVLGRPVQDVSVVLLDLQTSRRCPSTLIGACASVCLKEALKQADCSLLEPMVYLETTVPESYYHAVNAELLRRRAEMLDTKSNLEEKTRTVMANVPLSQMVDFNALLRRLTSGAGVMHMEVKEYARVPPQELPSIIQQVTGIRYKK